MGRVALTCASIALAAAVAWGAPAASTNRPNVLLIVADDLGFSDLGCYGSEIATPQLDRLAREGIRFSQVYNSSRCCPTRASLLTGLYPQQAGMGNMAGGANGRIGYEGRLMERCVTLPEALRPAGYQSYMVGKWHLNARPSPVDRGFGEFYGMLEGFNTCWEEQPHFTRLPAGRPKRSYAPGQFYATDVFGDYALDFLADARKTNQPWFLYLAFNAPHFPLHAPEADIAKYEKLYARGWDAIREERLARLRKSGLIPTNTVLTPRGTVPANWANEKTGWDDKPLPAWDSLPAERRADLARRMGVYAAMIDRMDQNIGRVLENLRQHNEQDRTLIVFLSDNGACAEWDPFGFDGESGPQNVLHTGDDLRKVGGPESYISYGSGWANACNTPWRLFKHYGHEGGVASPCIVRLPAEFTRKGAIDHTPIHVIDVMPTVLELAGAEYPNTFAGHAILAPEGKSLVPIFEGTSFPPRPLFFEHEGNRSVRDGKWKLVALSGKPWELYDIERDRTELNDLSATHPEVATRLAAAWDAWAERSLVRRSPRARVSSIPNPQIASRPLEISCEVEPTVSKGVILAQGGNRYGYALWLADNQLHFGVRIDRSLTSIATPELPRGRLSILARLKSDGAMELSVNGTVRAEGKAPGTIPVQPIDPLSVAEDFETAAGDYQPPNPLPDAVEKVRIKVD
jgi:arylsulfatase A-like enzyme